ncbi:MAG: alpha-glucan family phosphorylase [Solirubrobacteraceae bacterium]
MTRRQANFNDGLLDTQRAAGSLARRLPAPLRPLAQAAYNYRWSWTPGGDELFAAIDPERWQLVNHNPVDLLTRVTPETLSAAASDPAVVQGAADLWAQISADLARPSAAVGVSEQRPVAFFCAEYGVHVSLPVYSGGLGALAGDILKEASDRAFPMVAVGLMYRRGYFRQRVDGSGVQHEYWVDSDPGLLPVARVTGADGRPLTVKVPIAEASVTVAIWRVNVGRVPLYLLDADLPENTALQRWFTARLYDGDADIRLAQYTLLGAGGMRALQALGVKPGVVHLNEGHAVLAPLELARQLGPGPGVSPRALTKAKALTVFTTHTPVPAGNDTYPAGEVAATVAGLLDEWAFEPERLIALGQTDAEDRAEPFGITQAALRLSRSAGGVSRRHGQVAREMWQGLWPWRQPDDVPIGYVTNGVHVPTWMGEPMRRLLDERLGEGWMFKDDVASAWAEFDGISDERLWAVRCQQRTELVRFLVQRSLWQRLERGDSLDYAGAAAAALDPDVLTVGFARRVATYKRLDLLVRDPEFVLRLLSGDRPVQFVLAGKAHPRDDEAKQVLQRVFGLKWAREVAERVVFVDDYDLSVGAQLTRGCDLWLNLPRPPLEASGTSGMKSVLNGGLQLSVLDGWWAEGFDGHNGWAIDGEIDEDTGAQDDRHAIQLQALLLDRVLPAFYERGTDGLPHQWLSMMRRSLRTLGPVFSASRMVGEYMQGPYLGGARRHAGVKPASGRS